MTWTNIEPTVGDHVGLMRKMTLTQRHCQPSSNNAMLAQWMTALWGTVEIFECFEIWLNVENVNIVVPKAKHIFYWLSNCVIIWVFRIFIFSSPEPLDAGPCSSPVIKIGMGWLNDYIVFYAVSAKFRPYNGGSWGGRRLYDMKVVSGYAFLRTYYV